MRVCLEQLAQSHVIWSRRVIKVMAFSHGEELCIADSFGSTARPSELLGGSPAVIRSSLPVMAMEIGGRRSEVCRPLQRVSANR